MEEVVELVKIVSFPSDGTVVRIKTSEENGGKTTIMNPIDGTKMLIGGSGWEIDGILAVAPGKRPIEPLKAGLFGLSTYTIIGLLAMVWYIKRHPIR